MEDEVDELNAPTVKSVGFKRKFSKKKSSSRRKLLNDSDDEVPVGFEVKIKPEFKSSFSIKKKVVPKLTPLVLDLDLEDDDEFNPIIENIDDIENVDINIKKSIPKSPPPRKKYVPIVSTSTDFIPPTIKQYQQEYEDYDPEDITEKNDKLMENAGDENDDNDDDISGEANEGQFLINTQSNRPNKEFYDLELNDSDDEVKVQFTENLILSISDQIEQINLNQKRSIEAKLQKEIEIDHIKNQLKDIEFKKSELLKELQS